MSYGWNSTCYQILNPGMEHWFPTAIPAVVGYTRRHNLLLVAGAPVCAREMLPTVCADFENFARRQGCRVCYVCAEERLHSLFAHSANHATITMGAQPVWDPRHWPQLVQRISTFRAQLNRSRNKAVSVEEVAAEDAAKSPELQRVLRQWLNARRLPPLQFLVAPNVLDGEVRERVVLVARRNGVVIAYLVASPVVAKEGYLVELLARSPVAPNGTSELLIDAAMQRFARDGRSYATLGLVVLASAAEGGIRGNPFWLRSLMQFARMHANRFYNFRGLEHFRVKMAPRTWEPVYAISTEQRFSPRTLYSLGAAFSGIPPWLAIGKGVVNAVRQEIHGKNQSQAGKAE
jgi:phosphatidylglycerol lysyltransferase